MQDFQTNNLDINHLLLFAGIGVLFVVGIDVLVRLLLANHNNSSSTKSSPAGAITIEGRTYVPL